MYYIKKFIAANLIVAVVFGVFFAIDHFISTSAAFGFLFSVLLSGFAFGIILLIGLYKNERELSVKIEKEDIGADGIMDYMKLGGRRIDMGYLKYLKPESEQPTYANLTPAQQVMKSEESALRARVKETVRFRDSDAFKGWDDGRQNALLSQLGAMVLYHCILLSRCIQEGVLLEIDSSDSSDSSSSSGSSTDSSSSDGSSSDGSGSSSSDSSDSSSSSSSSSSNNEKPQPKK